jgi:phosphoribosylamine--glycine ligase
MTDGRPARILLVGAGGREHALAWKLVRDAGVEAVIAAPGSAGMAMEAGVQVVPGADPLDGAGLTELARTHHVDLAVVGPEAPLAAGVADALRAAGIPTFGPGAAAARIESSKAWCHEIAAAAGVRMAASAAFAELEPALDWARDRARRGRGVVIKADGLAAGKGVTVCDAAEQAELALRAIFAMDRRGGEPGAPRVVVEERLFGPEASLIALCDGRDVIACPPARDHKRLFDGDRGPNTGGMGAYSPLDDLSDEEATRLVGSIHRPILAELARRGTPFIGALYAGLILTADGPVLLECNARFGDPETQVILPRLDCDLAPLLLAAAEGRLTETVGTLGIRGALLPARAEAAVGVVLAAEGYPDAPVKGDPIAGLGLATAAGGLVFHAGTAPLAPDRFQTAGGRVLTVVALGRDLADARRRADAASDRIAFRGMQRRGDIAGIVVHPVADLPGAETAILGGDR